MTLIVVRHGDTKLNNEGKVRGQLDIPMTSAGKQQVAITAKHFKETPVTHIYASDLQRSSGAAKILAAHMKSSPKIVESKDLRPWNMGNLQGHSVGAQRAQIHQFYDNPDTPTPGGGESYNQFLKRILPHVKAMVESPTPHVMVSHNRVMHMMEALAAGGGKGVDPQVLKAKDEGTTQPGHVMVLDKTWKPKFFST